MKRLFVSNLPWKTTVNDLKTVFKEVGTVHSATLLTEPETGRSKGSAFVEMEDLEAQRAIFHLDGKELDGRPIRVREARPELAGTRTPRPESLGARSPRPEFSGSRSPRPDFSGPRPARPEWPRSEPPTMNRSPRPAPRQPELPLPESKGGDLRPTRSPDRGRERKTVEPEVEGPRKGWGKARRDPREARLHHRRGPYDPDEEEEEGAPPPKRK